MEERIFDLVKLHFKSPLHLSRGQTEYYDRSETIMHSDTLKSAIFVAARQLYGEQIDEQFLKSFIISSGFPFCSDDYLLPKPLIDLKVSIEGYEDGPKKHKKLKKLKYISKDYYEKIIHNKAFKISPSQFSEDGNLLCKTLKPPVFFKSELQQRLNKPIEENKQSTPYYVDRVFFNTNAGLYFFINILDKKSQLIIINALKLLESEGFGTDRNVGNGQFSTEYKENGFTISVPENNTASTLLSLYLPKKEELTKEVLENSYYSLLKRGGYISNPEDIEFVTFRKKSVYMFVEGSVFGKNNIKGCIADLKPDNVNNLEHPIWRDGQALAIPISI